MDKWDVFKENLSYAQNADGSLQKQADIYAESWQAASKRVKAAMQGIYDELLNDSAFISITNGVAAVVEEIDNVINAIGGLKGTLSLASVLFLKMFGSDISTSINNFIYNLKLGTQQGKDAILQTRKDFNEQLIAMADTGTGLGSAQVEIYKQQASVQQELITKADILHSKNKEISADEQTQVDLLMDISNKMGEEYQQATQNLEKLKQQSQELQKQATQAGNFNAFKITNDDGSNINKYSSAQEYQQEIETLVILQEAFSEAEKLKIEFFNASEIQGDSVAQEALNKIIKKLDDIKPITERDKEAVVELREALENLSQAKGSSAINKNFSELEDTLARIGGVADEGFDELIDSITETDTRSKRLKKTLQELRESAKATGEGTADAAVKSNNYSQSITTLKERIENLHGTVGTITDRIISLGSALSSFSMMINSIKGISDTLSDPDMSGWDKLVAILGSVGLLLPTIITSMGQVNKAFGIESSIIEALTAKTVAFKAAKLEANALDEAELAMSALKQKRHLETVEIISAEIVARKLDIASMTEEQVIEEICNIAKTKGITLNERQVQAIYKKILAQQASASADKAATIAQTAFNSSLLACPITWIIAGLTAIIGVLSLYEKHLEKVAEKQREFNQKEYEASKTQFENAKSESDNVTSLYQSYIDAQNSLDGTKDSKEKLKSATEDLCKVLGVEWDALDKLQGKYEAVNKEILKSQQDKIKETIKAAQDEINDANDVVEDKVDSVVDEYDFGHSTGVNANGSNYDRLYTNIDYGLSYGDTNDKAVLSSFTDWLEQNYSDKIYNFGRDAQGNAMGAIQFNEGVTEAEVIEILREGFAYLRDEGNFDTKTQDNSEAYQWLRTLYNDTDTSDVLTTIDTAQTTIDESLAQLAGIATQLEGTDYSQVTEDNYANYRDDYIKKLKTTMEANGQDTSKYSDEEYEQIADDYLSSTFTNIAGIINNLNLKDSIIEHVSSIEGGEEFVDQVADEGNLDLFANIQIDEETSLANIKAQYEQVKAQAKLEDINVKINTSTDAIDSLLEDKDLTEDQLTALQELENEYGELATIQDKGSAEYLNKLIEIREALEAEQHEVQQLAENSKIDDISVDLNKAETESQIEDLQDELLDLCDQDYDILVNVKSDIQDDFDTTVSSIEDLEEAASKIGEDFVVAGEDIEELNDVFPGILAGLEDLGDGTAKLNSDIVQSAIEAAELEVAANTDATVQKLKNQATELEAKRDAARSIAEIASNLVGTEKLSDEQKGELDTALNKLKSDNSSATSDQVQTDDANIADTAAQASTSMANSFGTAYQQMAQDAVTFATTAHQALLAATDENQAIPSVGTFGGASFSTTASVTPTSSDKADLNNYSDYSDVDNWQEVSDYYDNLAKSYDEAYNNTLGKIDELLIRGQGSKNSFNNISKGSGSSGKSSSSGGSSKDPDQKDYEEYLDDEAELYHDIKEAIKDVEHEMTKLEKEQSHMYGGALISSLKAENKLLSQQRANYIELNKEIQERNNSLKSTLSAYGDADDYYNTYNNIQSGYNAAVDSYNQLIDTYNSMSAEQQESYESTIDAAKDQLDVQKDVYDKMMDYLEEYYNNKEELRSNDEKQQELLYEQIENNLKAYETEIELKLDTTEAERSLSEFLKKIQTDIKNLYKTSAEWAAEFENDQFNANSHATDAQTHMDQLSYYKQIYNNKQWGGENDIFASESEAINAIVEAEKQLLEDGNTLLEDYEDAYSDLKDAFSEVVDQFDDIIDNFDRIDDTLDHYQKINELLYGESASGRQNAATSYQVAVENSIAKQNALNSYIKALQQKRIDALAKGYDEDDDYVKNIDDEINNKTSELESAIENYINTIQSQLENTIQMAKEAMDKSIWGDSLTNIQQQWDDKKAMAEGYYDEVEKIYELESLESKWQSAINSTTSIKAQQQLKSLMEAQVESLKNKTALSEKDVELAEKEIAVYQAQIALEEAQNAKNSMKLIRDESGNWSYQYIADEDDVADKQQDYLEKLNQWRTSAVEATESIKENIIEAYTNFSERMAELASDTTLTEEERTARMAELTETYYGEDGIITKAVEDSNYIQSISNQATFQELWELYQNDQAAYEQMTENEKALIDGLRDQGIEDYSNLRDFIIGSDKKSGAYGDILDTAKEVNKESSFAWDSMAADAIEKMYGKDGKLDKSSVTGVVQQAYKDMQTALEQYNKAIETSEKASGTEWSKVGIQLVGTDGNGGVKGQIDSVTNAIQGVIDKIGSLNDFESKVLEIESAWYAVGASIQSATNDLYAYLSLLNSGGSGSSGSSSSGGSSSSSSGSKSGSGNGSNSGNTMGNSGSGGDGKLSVGDTATYSGKYYYTSQGASPTGSKYSGVTNGVVVDMVNDSYGDYSYHIHSADGSYSDLGWVKKSQLSGYDTGGYTGSWDGGDGRLALLHSKELVLNADDTSNFLTAVSAIRDIASLGDISSTIASGVASLVRSMLGFSNNNLSNAFSSNNNTTEGNTFNISAEFPNANNAEEIREAIMSLPTLASQYLSRNNL